MLVALAIIGVIVMFSVGWVLGRASRTTGDSLALEQPELPQPMPIGTRDLLDDHRVGVAVLSERGVVQYRNAAIRQFAGTHVGVLLDDAIERHAEIARSGGPSTETLEIYGPPRTVLVVEARPISVGGAVVFVDDVSDRRRIDQMRTDFVANISHELKTPVGAMSVLAETLQGENDRETIDRIVERMMTEAQRAARTIDDLLELSRIELGGDREVESITVADLIAGALDRVRELSAQRGIGLSTLDPVADDGTRTGDLQLHGDRRQLVSALGNLVENAVKYSRENGSVQLRATHGGDWIEISVTDQGIGIPQRDLDRVFERFYRVDRARSRDTGGTGLGLSIVRHVATNHGGDVLVTSVEGEGSTFVLRLPRGRASSRVGTAGADHNHEGVA